MHGVDIGRRLSRDDAGFLYRRGFRFVARYYALDPNNPKCLTPDEAVNILAEGLAILPVFEETGAPPFSYQAGQAAAAAADAFALRCGQPIATPICFAIDTGAPGELVDYFNGVFDTIGEKYINGIYGSYDVTKLARENYPALGFFWQTYAWSSGQEYLAADVEQYKNNVTLRNDLVVDLNIARSLIPWRLSDGHS